MLSDMGMMINRRRVMGGKKLPYDAEIEYLESNGTQAIDTGINPQVAPNAIVDMTMLNGADRDYWGNLTSLDGASYVANFALYNLKYYRYGSNRGVDIGAIGAGRHVVQVGKEVYVDGVLKYTSPNTYVPAPSAASIKIFNSNRNMPASYRLHSFKLYDGDTVVRDYIPVRIGNIGYLYDKVSGTLFGNAGTGNFILGADK